MKNIAICCIGLLTLMLGGISCSKELSPDTPQSTVAQNVECKDGTLYFANADACITIMNSISDDKNRKEFERTNGFKSLSSYIEEAFEAISQVETEDVFRSALEHFSDIVEVNDREEILPVVKARCYTNIADREGVFYIGDVKHQITKEDLIITPTTTDPTTKADAPIHFEYIETGSEDNTKAETTSRDEVKFVDVRYEGSDRKVFARANIIKFMAYEEQPGSILNTVYKTQFVYQIHVSGQMKGLFGWNSYDTEFTLERFHWKYYTDGNGLDNIVKSNGSVYNFYVDNYSQIYRTDVFSIPSMPKDIGELRFRALSRGTANCGAVYENCWHGPTTNIPQCK